MPELPEVEAARMLLEAHCLGKAITDVITSEPFDSIVIGEGVTAARLRSALLQRTVEGVHRRGKQLWLELSGDGPCLLMHFGMTGSVIVEGVPPLSYQSFKVDELQFPPRFTKLELALSDGAGDDDGEGGGGSSNSKGGGRSSKKKEKKAHSTSSPPSSSPAVVTRLAYCDPRRLGRLLLREGDPMATPPLSKLAPDPLLAPPSAEAFRDRLLALHGTTPIKATLLAQDKLVCGVGNWVADEVLYQARIHPSAPGPSLSDAQMAALHGALIDVVSTAVAAAADAKKFPEHWLFHRRWGKGNSSSSSSTEQPKKKNRKGKGDGGGAPSSSSASSSSSPVDFEGERISFEAVAGRTSAVVLSRQKKGERGKGGGAAEEKKAPSSKKGTKKAAAPGAGGKGKKGGSKKRKR